MSAILTDEEFEKLPEETKFKIRESAQILEELQDAWRAVQVLSPAARELLRDNPQAINAAVAYALAKQAFDAFLRVPGQDLTATAFFELAKACAKAERAVIAALTPEPKTAEDCVGLVDEDDPHFTE